MADDARDATLRVLSAPVLPVICILLSVILAIVWATIAFKRRIRILTGTVTVGSEAPKKLKIEITAPDYSLTLQACGGAFTVYDIPDAKLTVKVTLPEAEAGTPPCLTYANLEFGKKKTKHLDARLPLRPVIHLDPIEADDTHRMASWTNPVLDPATDTFTGTYKYIFEFEVKASGASTFSKLATEVEDKKYAVAVKKGSIVRCTAHIDGLSQKLIAYFSI